MSAVSNSVTPRSIALWITLREASRSMRWPKLLQPRPTAETRRPEPPRFRICMDQSCVAVAKTGLFQRTRYFDRATPVRKARSGLSKAVAAPCHASHAEIQLVLGQIGWRRDKKMRPRSDAATDGDRWGA